MTNTTNASLANLWLASGHAQSYPLSRPLRKRRLTLQESPPLFFISPLQPVLLPADEEESDEKHAEEHHAWAILVPLAHVRIWLPHAASPVLRGRSPKPHADKNQNAQTHRRRRHGRSVRQALLSIAALWLFEKRS